MKSASRASYEDPEHSRWIHRDKLAQIESQELRQAGIFLAREPRSESRQASVSKERTESRQAGLVLRERSESRQAAALPANNPEQQSVSPRAVVEQSPQRLSTPENSRPFQLSPEEVAEEIFDEPMSFDLRLPEEAALDAEEAAWNGQQGYRYLGKNGYSRIPLSKSSPIPVPMDFIGRETPLPRNASGSWEEEGIPYGRLPRGRSQSVGSQTLLDDGDENSTSTNRRTPPASPSKSKPPIKGPITGTVNGRKGSAPRALQRPRTRSAQNRDASGVRPSTRDGTPVKRPEGDPPWLEGTYRPDPMLPPDQQLLPTVAKRLQQEQWEKEGKFGSTYDRKLNPLNVDDYEASPNIKSQVIEVPEQPVDPQWPLKSPASIRTNTSTADHGGYKTMPSVTDPVSAMAAQKAQPAQPLRIQEPPEEPKKKGLCGCCILM
ncbi:MAG: hypothetical protein M1829_003480 [Trizodia sp. TS-e1964]|nr:MAG: hypothetical protein M1829_003480 [Trizodia sp. TS-e1964]